MDVPRKRRRPALSCVECRRRKIKCDRNRPCSQCTRCKGTICTLLDPALSMRNRILADKAGDSTTSSTQNHDSPAHSVVHAMTGTYSASRDYFPITGVPERPRNPVEADSANQLRHHSVNTQGSQADPAVRDPGHKVQGLDQRLSKRSSPQPDGLSKTSCHSPGSMPDLRGRLSKTRFFGQTHWMNSAEPFERLGGSTSFDAGGKLEMHCLLEKCKRMARVVKAERPIEQPIPHDIRDYVPQRNTSDQLVALYLGTFETIYRVLHIPSFKKEYLQYWSDPQAKSTAFVLKLLLVMAIGTCFHRDAGESTNLRSTSLRWIYAAQSWLSSPFEKSRLNVSGLQIQCLLLLARETHAIDPDLIWISAGSLLRTAMSMGLHRDPIHFPKMTVFQSEIRRRLWATILEISVQSSLESGMPPMISYQDFDCTPPSNINDEEIEEATRTLPSPNPADTFTQTSTQIMLIRSLRTRLEVTKLLNSFRSDCSYEETLRLGADLTAACFSNSELMQHFLSSRSTLKQAQPTALAVKLLDLLVRLFLLCLHRPFASQARTNPIYYFSRKICVESSLILLSYSYSPEGLDGTWIPVEDDYTRLALLGGGVFKANLVHASTSICLELIHQLEQDPSPIISASIETLTRNELHKAVQCAVDLAMRRIEAGETSAKGYVFLSCVLGQINAMQAGTSPEQGILDAARKSVEVCHQLLRAKMKYVDTDPEHTDHQLHNRGDDGSQDMAASQAEDDGGFGWDLLMEQDCNLDFDMPDSWLSLNWENTYT